MADDELKPLFDEMRQENAAAREENAAAHAETRRLFVETADRIAAENRYFFAVGTEATRHEIQLVAEGLAQTREELARTASGHDAKIERTAAETQAMIKFSHDELQRRVRTLEDSVVDLHARVERLEGSTH